MPDQPILTTLRLILRPFRKDDADEVQRLVSDKAVAATTLHIPHPYEDGLADAWIETHKERFESDDEAVFAVTQAKPTTTRLIGAIGLLRHKQLNPCLGELGYWIGRPFWNRGYCTEAAEAMIRFGFETWSLNRIHAHHFASNPASGRVMEKIGMKREGLLRQHVKKGNALHDIAIFGLLKTEFEP